MQLTKLLKNIDYTLLKGKIDIDIKDIYYDSRTIKKDIAFICLVGIDTDGHDYIEEAIKNGSNCIIVCKDITIDADVTIIKIKDTRTELSILSANFFDNPADKLIKIAITGTKGKTSTSWMIKSILEQNGDKVGLIGTIGTLIDGTIHSHKNTTPESYQIQKFMRQMVDSNTKYLVMETSSQALKVGRINNIIFDYALFTNLSLDHVGPREHPTYEDYINSKALLFKQSKIGILNKDDQEFHKMIKQATSQNYTYGQNESNLDLNISNIKALNTSSFLGTAFQVTTAKEKITFKVSAPGEFSAYNAASAILLCQLLNIDNQTIQKGLENFKALGRCEIFNINNKFKVIIDFAHNKISMESIIQTIKNYKPNRVITIFGCGGGRSFDRRYELGVISGKLADLSIITTDNPRNDDIDKINNDIKQGVISQHGNYLIIKDREEAITYALKHAQENDIILLLGKGHENYQEIKGIKYNFNEKEIINNFITKANLTNNQK